MLKNSLLVTIRGLRRKKGYAAINIAGLALGLACCILLMLYVQSERAVDSVFADADRIHRVGSVWADDGLGLPITAPAPVGATMTADLPEVESAVRLWAGWLTIRPEHDDDAPALRHSAYVADANVLSFFGLPLLHGDAATALDQPRTVAIRDDLARALFGTAEAVGETLLVETYTNGTQPYTITAVWDDLPYNSLTDFNSGDYPLIVTYTEGDMLDQDGWTSWDSRYLLQYIKLRPGTTEAAVTAKLDAFVQRHAPADLQGLYQPVLEPLRSLYLDQDGGRNRRAVWLLMGLAGLILLVACINFANLSTAQALDRGKEIGVRKSLGAHRGQLVGALLGEALLVASAATVLGAALAWTLHRPFFAMAGKPLVLDTPWGAPMLLALIAIALCTGVLAGGYPALVLSGFHPIQALKGTLRAGPSSVRLRQGLVVAQYAAAVLLLGGAAVVYQQVRFLQDTPLGFEQDEVILAIESVPRDWSPDGVDRLQPVKAQLEAIPGIRAVSLSWETAAEGSNNTLALRRPGQAAEESRSIDRFVVDEDFAAVYGLHLVDGTFFQDGDEGLIVNEQAATLLGIDRPGESLVLGDSTVMPVQAIVRDFHFASLHTSIRPLVLAPLTVLPQYRMFSLRIAPGNLAEAVRRIETTWREALPAVPFAYTFVDDQVAAQYVTERRTGTVVGLAAFLALFVAGLGVVGLVALNVRQRRKEIGVRKVLGAHPRHILALFVREFGTLVLIGSAVAIPLAVVLAGRWLDSFAYRIDLSAGPFVIAAILALSVTLLTVGLQTYRAATAAPTDSLRYE